MRRECVLEQIFGACIRGVGSCVLFETRGTDFESKRGCSGSHASWALCRVVGSCGEVRRVPQRSSKVVYMGAMW